MHGAQANRGVFIITSSFNNEAIIYADRVAARVVLIDGITLAQLMVTHNVGVQDRETYVIKRVDEDFIEETYAGGAVLLAARFSRPGPPRQGQAARGRFASLDTAHPA